MSDLKYIKSKLEFTHSQLNAALGVANIDVFVKCPAASASFFGAILKVCGQSSALATIRLSRATAAADGTPETPKNRSQLDTPPTSVVTVFSTPTTPVEVELLKQGFSNAAQDYETGPFILKPATNYLVRLSNATGTIAACIGLDICVIPNFDYLYKG